MTGDCENFTGYKTHEGYGRKSWRGKVMPAHRVAYEQTYGPIPDGMTVDHLCFNPSCVNPAHLRLLTPSENARNQRSANATHCRNGHEFTEVNTYRAVSPKGLTMKNCRTCNAAAQRRRKQRLRERDAA